MNTNDIINTVFEPNNPPNRIGHYWYCDLDNNSIDIVSVTESYKNGSRCLFYTFFNDNNIYLKDQLDKRFYFFDKEIYIPAEVINYKIDLKNNKSK